MAWCMCAAVHRSTRGRRAVGPGACSKAPSLYVHCARTAHALRTQECPRTAHALYTRAPASGA
eukprot:scaffold40561_cov72-Phaeocystis_antarctica.AAC.3